MMFRFAYRAPCLQVSSLLSVIVLAIGLCGLMAQPARAVESTVAIHRDQLANLLARKPKIVMLNNQQLSAIVDQMTRFSKRLPGQFFDGTRLKEAVRDKSISFANARFAELGLPGLKIVDMLYVGSLASFEYDDLSDVDIHIIIDPASFPGEKAMLRRYLSKVNDLNEFLYNRVTFYGRKADFTFYADTVENRIEPGVGIYSLFAQNWPSEPQPAPIRFSRARVLAELKDYIARYNDLARTYGQSKQGFNCELFSELREEVRLYRRKGIAKDGIRSTENIVYRSLRRVNGNLLRQMEDLELECENIQGSLQ